MRPGGSRALYLELAARGVCLRTGVAPVSMPPDTAGELLRHVRANRAGLKEILMDRIDPDLEAVRREGRAS